MSTSIDTIEQYLRQKKGLKQYFMPLAEEAPIHDGFDHEFEGNLAKIIPQIHRESNTKVLLVTRNIGLQMGKLLEKMVAYQCGFIRLPVDAFYLYDNCLRIADPTGLRFLKEITPYEQGADSESKSMTASPPENNTHNRVFVEKMHAYLFGKWLYQLISGEPEIGLQDLEASSRLSFRDPLFQTTEGHIFQQIIIQLLNPNYSARISLKEALALLKNINPMLIQQKECAYCLLGSIKQCIGERAGIEEFIQDYESRINTATLDSIKSIYNLLEKLASAEEKKLRTLQIEILSLVDKIKEIYELPQTEPQAFALEDPKKYYEMIDDAPISTLEPLLLMLRNQYAQYKAAHPFANDFKIGLQLSPNRRYHRANRTHPPGVAGDKNQFFSHKGTTTAAGGMGFAPLTIHFNPLKSVKEEKEEDDSLGIEKTFKHTLTFTETNHPLFKKRKSSVKETYETSALVMKLPLSGLGE